jgi:hypothetical protein
VCSKLCSYRVDKRQVGTRRDRIGVERFSARTREFRRDSRNANRRENGLANRRLQPLGHLTAARNLSINEIAVYGLSSVPSIVPETVPARSQNRRGAATLSASGAPIRTQRFFSPTTMPAIDWRASLYSHEPASTFLVVTRGGTRKARGSGARLCHRQAPVPLNRCLLDDGMPAPGQVDS